MPLKKRKVGRNLQTGNCTRFRDFNDLVDEQERLSMGNATMNFLHEDEWVLRDRKDQEFTEEGSEENFPLRKRSTLSAMITP